MSGRRERQQRYEDIFGNPVKRAPPRDAVAVAKTTAAAQNTHWDLRPLASWRMAGGREVGFGESKIKETRQQVDSWGREVSDDVDAGAAVSKSLVNDPPFQHHARSQAVRRDFSEWEEGRVDRELQALKGECVYDPEQERTASGTAHDTRKPASPRGPPGPAAGSPSALQLRDQSPNDVTELFLRNGQEYTPDDLVAVRHTSPRRNNLTTVPPGAVRRSKTITRNNRHQRGSSYPVRTGLSIDHRRLQEEEKNRRFYDFTEDFDFEYFRGYPHILDDKVNEGAESRVHFVPPPPLPHAAAPGSGPLGGPAREVEQPAATESSAGRDGALEQQLDSRPEDATARQKVIEDVERKKFAVAEKVTDRGRTSSAQDLQEAHDMRAAGKVRDVRTTPLHEMFSFPKEGMMKNLRQRIHERGLPEMVRRGDNDVPPPWKWPHLGKGYIWNHEIDIRDAQLTTPGLWEAQGVTKDEVEKADAAARARRRMRVLGAPGVREREAQGKEKKRQVKFVRKDKTADELQTVSDTEVDPRAARLATRYKNEGALSLQFYRRVLDHIHAKETGYLAPETKDAMKHTGVDVKYPGLSYVKVNHLTARQGEQDHAALRGTREQAKRTRRNDGNLKGHLIFPELAFDATSIAQQPLTKSEARPRSEEFHVRRHVLQQRARRDGMRRGHSGHTTASTAFTDIQAGEDYKTDHADVQATYKEGQKQILSKIGPEMGGSGNPSARWDMPRNEMQHIANMPQLYEDKHAFLKNQKKDREHDTTAFFYPEEHTPADNESSLAWLDLDLGKRFKANEKQRAAYSCDAMRKLRTFGHTVDGTNRFHAAAGSANTPIDELYLDCPLDPGSQGRKRDDGVQARRLKTRSGFGRRFEKATPVAPHRQHPNVVGGGYAGETKDAEATAKAKEAFLTFMHENRQAAQNRPKTHVLFYPHRMDTVKRTIQAAFPDVKKAGAAIGTADPLADAGRFVTTYGESYKTSGRAQSMPASPISSARVRFHSRAMGRIEEAAETMHRENAEADASHAGERNQASAVDQHGLLFGAEGVVNRLTTVPDAPCSRKTTYRDNADVPSRLELHERESLELRNTRVPDRKFPQQGPRGKPGEQRRRVHVCNQLRKEQELRRELLRRNDQEAELQEQGALSDARFLADEANAGITVPEGTSVNEVQADLKNRLRRGDAEMQIRSYVGKTTKSARLVTSKQSNRKLEFQPKLRGGRRAAAGNKNKKGEHQHDVESVASLRSNESNITPLEARLSHKSGVVVSGTTSKQSSATAGTSARSTFLQGILHETDSQRTSKRTTGRLRGGANTKTREKETKPVEERAFAPSSTESTGAAGHAADDDHKPEYPLERVAGRPRSGLRSAHARTSTSVATGIGPGEDLPPLEEVPEEWESVENTAPPRIHQSLRELQQSDSVHDEDPGFICATHVVPRTSYDDAYGWHPAVRRSRSATALANYITSDAELTKRKRDEFATLTREQTTLKPGHVVIDQALFDKRQQADAEVVETCARQRRERALEKGLAKAKRLQQRPLLVPHDYPDDISDELLHLWQRKKFQRLREHMFEFRASEFGHAVRLPLHTRTKLLTSSKNELVRVDANGNLYEKAVPEIFDRRPMNAEKAKELYGPGGPLEQYGAQEVLGDELTRERPPNLCRMGAQLGLTVIPQDMQPEQLRQKIREKRQRKLSFREKTARHVTELPASVKEYKDLENMSRLKAMVARDPEAYARLVDPMYSLEQSMLNPQQDHAKNRVNHRASPGATLTEWVCLHPEESNVKKPYLASLGAATRRTDQQQLEDKEYARRRGLISKSSDSVAGSLAPEMERIFAGAAADEKALGLAPSSSTTSLPADYTTTSSTQKQPARTLSSAKIARLRSTLVQQDIDEREDALKRCSFGAWNDDAEEGDKVYMWKPPNNLLESTVDVTLNEEGNLILLQENSEHHEKLRAGYTVDEKSKNVAPAKEKDQLTRKLQKIKNKGVRERVQCIGAEEALSDGWEEVTPLDADQEDFRRENFGEGGQEEVEADAGARGRNEPRLRGGRQQPVVHLAHSDRHAEMSARGSDSSSGVDDIHARGQGGQKRQIAFALDAKQDAEEQAQFPITSQVESQTAHRPRVATDEDLIWGHDPARRANNKRSFHSTHAMRRNQVSPERTIVNTEAAEHNKNLHAEKQEKHKKSRKMSSRGASATSSPGRKTDPSELEQDHGGAEEEQHASLSTYEHDTQHLTKKITDVAPSGRRGVDPNMLRPGDEEFLKAQGAAYSSLFMKPERQQLPSSASCSALDTSDELQRNTTTNESAPLPLSHQPKRERLRHALEKDLSNGMDKISTTFVKSEKPRNRFYNSQNAATLRAEQHPPSPTAGVSTPIHRDQQETREADKQINAQEDEELRRQQRANRSRTSVAEVDELEQQGHQQHDKKMKNVLQPPSTRLVAWERPWGSSLNLKPYQARAQVMTTQEAKQLRTRSQPGTRDANMRQRWKYDDKVVGESSEKTTDRDKYPYFVSRLGEETTQGEVWTEPRAYAGLYDGKYAPFYDKTEENFVDDKYFTTIPPHRKPHLKNAPGDDVKSRRFMTSREMEERRVRLPKSPMYHLPWDPYEVRLFGGIVCGERDSHDVLGRSPTSAETKRLYRSVYDKQQNYDMERLNLRRTQSAGHNFAQVQQAISRSTEHDGRITSKLNRSSPTGLTGEEERLIAATGKTNTRRGTRTLANGSVSLTRKLFEEAPARGMQDHAIEGMYTTESAAQFRSTKFQPDAEPTAANQRGSGAVVIDGTCVGKVKERSEPGDKKFATNRRLTKVKSHVIRTVTEQPRTISSMAGVLSGARNTTADQTLT
ncbi:unnamed protein product [Amoebophrya sp. A120]|nr:unnamed protein product [Amoebophrya sp. A120]|eukprot:GSA120T00002391001.1